MTATARAMQPSITESTAKRVESAIEMARGDDLDRLTKAFKGLGESELDRAYGDSGKTFREVLQGRQDHAAECQAASDLVHGLSKGTMQTISPQQAALLKKVDTWISDAKGDDLERFEVSVRGCSPAQMNEPHGRSSLTSQQHLNILRMQRDSWNEAQADLSNAVAKFRVS